MRENGSPAIFPTRPAICSSRSSSRSSRRTGARRWSARRLRRPVGEPPCRDAGGRQTNGPIFDVRATWSFEDYKKRFDRLHRHLREGDCYQANLTFPVEAKWTGDPLSAFDALAARQPVKYGALVALGEPVVLSRSPELFFEIDGDGWIETHPMKGTAPRGKTPDEDERAEGLPAPTIRRTRPRTA